MITTIVNGKTYRLVLHMVGDTNPCDLCDFYMRDCPILDTCIGYDEALADCEPALCASWKEVVEK